MTRPQSNAFGALEIEARTPERFLELLEDREEERAASGAEILTRRAVFVAPLKHVRLSEGIPLVTRRVRAAFAYGEDLVTLAVVTADGYEFPPPQATWRITKSARRRSSKRQGAKSKTESRP